MSMTRKFEAPLSGIAAAAGLLLTLTACNPGPKYVRPAAPAPVAYKETTPPGFKEGSGWKLAEPGDDKLRANWWALFNDPQLNALEEQVAISNQNIAAAEANYRNARSLVVSARSALFPTVTVDPTYNNSRISSTSRTTTTTGSGGGAAFSGGGSSIFNSFSFPIDASYTVDFWHRIRNQIAANAFSAQASAADVATATLSTQATLAQDYFQIRALDLQEGILQDTLANYRSSLELTQNLFKAGIDSEQDVTQAETQLDTATAQATDIGVSRAQFEHAIATLIGKPAAEFSLPPAAFVPQPPPVPVGLPSTLLERRPDIAANERQIAAANAEIGIARAAYYPNLTLSASAGFQTASFTQWFTWPSRVWSLGPQLSQTLFDGGARRAQNEQAEAAYDAAVANYRQTVLSAFQAVEDNLAGLRILAEEVTQQQTAIAASAHYLELAVTRYRTGVDSYLNVITAQNTVLTNRESQVQTQLRQMNASVSLILALGGGWEASSLPPMKDLLARPPKWSPGGGPARPGASGAAPAAVAPANPPQVPAVPLTSAPATAPTPSPGAGAANR